MRLPAALGVVILIATLAGAAAARPQVTAARVGGDWTRFGYDAVRSSNGPSATGITAANVGKLQRQRVVLDGTVDSSPIYLRGVRVAGRVRDVFFVTTSYGKTIALDAGNGRVLWRFTPKGYSGWAGSYQITNATPIADPSRRFVYAASPDGRIHKLSVAAGRESPDWPVAITRDAAREKIGPALNLSRGLVLAATGGYVGDAPPYQGHVVAINGRTGRIINVWNSLCSNRSGLLAEGACSNTGSAIWARAGVVVAPRTGNLLVATGNGPFDGTENWGDSVLMLSPTAGRLLQNWTPSNQRDLELGDVDLGSTAPALLSTRLVVQGGKDALFRLLDLGRLNGQGGAGNITGGELQSVKIAAGQFTAPVVWRTAGQTWVFVATGSSFQAFKLVSGRLQSAWTSPAGATSPVVAGGLLYAYDPDGSGLRVYRPTSGAIVARLPAGSGHWNSPIVTDGRIAIPEGNANDHALSGALDIYR